MTFRQRQDLFLGITLVAVVIGTIALIGWSQYEEDRDNHRTSQHKGE